MEKQTKSNTILAIILVFSVIIIGIGSSYAYFTATLTSTGDNAITITTANLRATYSDGTEITATAIKPGWKSSAKKITVTNTGDKDITYSIVWESLSYTGLTDFGYTYTSSTSKTSSPASSSVSTLKKFTTESAGSSFVPTTSIAPGVTHTYTVYFEFEYTNNDQTAQMNKAFSGKLKLVS